VADFRRRLEQIQNSINEKKMEKARLEERRDTLKREGDEIKEKLIKEIGDVDATEWLDKEKKEIEQGIEQCEQVLRT